MRDNSVSLILAYTSAILILVGMSTLPPPSHIIKDNLDSVKARLKIFRKNLKKKLDFLRKSCIIVGVRQGRKPLTKGSEGMEMTAAQTTRLIEWLKSQGMSPDKIVECIEYINK